MFGPHAVPRWQLGTASLLLAIATVVIQTGCSKDEIKQMATNIQERSQDLAVSAQEYTQAAVQVVEEQLPSTGSVSLRSSPPVEIDSATVEVIVIGDGRPNIVQIKTYDDENGPSSYPSLLVHGPTSVEDVSQLAGQAVSCDLYIQATGAGPITMTPPGDAVQVTFGVLDKESNTLKASIGSTRLISSDNKSSMLNGGNVVAKVQGGS